jgi:large subunit ribosomal protein L19
MKAKKYTRETIRSIGMEERNFPAFRVGDVISVTQRIIEGGEKERLQLFEGDVLAISNNGIASSFVVRKIAAGSIAVEKVFPYYSPLISAIKLVRRGRVRKAKLYYMRSRVGKAARVQERVVTRAQREQREAAQQSK